MLTEPDLQVEYLVEVVVDVMMIQMEQVVQVEEVKLILNIVNS